MNKNILVYITLASFFAINDTFTQPNPGSWLTSFTPNDWTSGWVLQIKNTTTRQQNIHAYFYACKDDHGYIEPGQTLYVWAGACHLKHIAVDGGKSYVQHGPGTGLHFS